MLLRLTNPIRPPHKRSLIRAHRSRSINQKWRLFMIRSELTTPPDVCSPDEIYWPLLGRTLPYCEPPFWHAVGRHVVQSLFVCTLFPMHSMVASAEKLHGFSDFMTNTQQTIDGRTWCSDWMCNWNKGWLLLCCSEVCNKCWLTVRMNRWLE